MVRTTLLVCGFYALCAENRTPLKKDVSRFPSEVEGLPKVRNSRRVSPVSLELFPANAFQRVSCTWVEFIRPDLRPPAPPAACHTAGGGRPRPRHHRPGAASRA